MDEREIDQAVPMTRDHVSKVLGVSLSSIDRMKRRGILELSGRIGNVVIFDRGSVSQVRDFLEMRDWFSGNVSGSNLEPNPEFDAQLPTAS